MAIWAEFDLFGIAPGDPITADNTDNFFDGGYPPEGRWTAAEVTGGGIGLRPVANASANGSKSLSGHATEGRIGWRVEFGSVGAATSYFESVMLRSADTIQADVGLRNAGGSREMAHRVNFGYIGQANGSPMTAGEQWSVELYWQGQSVTAYVWDSPDSTGAPTYTWGPSTMPSTVDNFLFGPDTADTVDAILYDLWISDGERRENEPLPGTLTFLSNAHATQTGVALAGKTAAAEAVELSVGASTATATPDADGYFRVSLGGLAAGQEHSWTLSVDGFVARTGAIRTLPSTADGMTILWGSCFDSYTSGFFALAADRDPDMIVNLGDWGYQYITGGTNGNTSPLDVATVRAHREPVLAAPAPQALFTAFPVSYTYSDCDGAGSNADGTTGGHATGAVQAAYRQQFAHPPLPLENSGARSWTVGRVRFIQTDETAAASVRDSTDDASKTKLGAEQKAWFKAEIDAAATAGQSVVWFGDGPWIEPAGQGSATYNSWAKYNTERTELGEYIATSGVKLVRLHGDTHTLFLDDGTNNQWGGFPTASAAPFHTTANPYQSPTTGGSWPTVQTNSSRQYGIAQIADDGDVLTIELHGFSSTNGEPAEVERFSEVFDITPGAAGDSPQPWDAVYVGDQPASAVYVGDEMVWSSLL